ncbi:hypothetical protein [uncultured Vagococcus sp.]|uniref:hypothetical protein n=1 Tax=uncultured Vagococcus sp. TaxID=189676 RepID=UPI0028D35D4B|nr:hypothetical protein [uncultured Vagococcus sp.]
MQKIQKKQLYINGNLAPLLELEMAPFIPSNKRKRKRKKRKNACIEVKENCSNEELRVILKTIDGNREILRTSDGRRVRTKTLTVKRSLKERMIQEKEAAKRSAKIKKAMFQTLVNQTAHVPTDLAQLNKFVLPIEKALSMVEVLGVIQAEND